MQDRFAQNGSMHTKGFIGLILVLIVVVIFGIVGTFYITRVKTNIPQESSLPSPTLPAASLSPTPVASSVTTRSAIVVSVEEYITGGMVPPSGSPQRSVSGSVAAGVTVRAVSTSKSSISVEAVTDAKGTARLPINPGKYYVYIVVPSTNIKAYILTQLPNGLISPDWQEVTVTADKVIQVKLTPRIAAV